MALQTTIPSEKSFRPTASINNSNPAHSEEDETITIMQNSMLDIKSWMDAVKLKLNETKTEFIYFGGKQQLAKTRRNTININGKRIQCTNKIKYLGGHLDSSLTLKDHIIAKSKAATINIIKIRNIRKYLNQDICHKLVVSLVLSHLDYSNSLLSGLPDSSTKILQKVQNSAARLVLGRNAKYSSTENIKQLHWLPIKQCIDYKVLTLVHKCLHQKAPKYLQDLLSKKVAKRQGIQSKGKVLLEVPHTKTRPSPVAVSVYMHQPKGTSYPTPLVMNTTLINSKTYLKLTSSTKLIINNVNVKHLS